MLSKLPTLLTIVLFSLSCKGQSLYLQSALYPPTVDKEYPQSSEPKEELVKSPLFLHNSINASKAIPNDVNHTNAVYRRRSKVEALRVRIGVSYGLAYRTQKINENYDDLLKEYEEKLNIGQVLNIFYAGGAGGLFYSRYTASNEMGPFEFEQEDGSTITGDISDDIVVHTGMIRFGKGFAFQDFPSVLYVATGFGISYYKNEAEFGNWYHMEGIGFNYLVDLTYDIILSEYFSLSLNTSLPRGKIKRGNYQDEDNDVNGNMNIKIGRFDATFGIIYTIPD